MSFRGWKKEETINFFFFFEHLVGFRSKLEGVELIFCPDLLKSVFEVLGVHVFWVLVYFGDVGGWRFCSSELRAQFVKGFAHFFLYIDRL